MLPFGNTTIDIFELPNFRKNNLKKIFIAICACHRLSSVHGLCEAEGLDGNKKGRMKRSEFGC